MWKKLTFSLPVLLAGMLLAPGGFAADKTAVTAIEVFDPSGEVLGMGQIGFFVYPGTVKCPGHEPTGNQLQPCPATSRTHLRNTEIISVLSSSDERATGLMTVVLNANWNTDFEGPVWGTFRIEVASGGTWVGTWQGLREREAEDQWTGTLHVIGKGYGGIVDGMKLMVEDRITSFTPAPIAYFGVIEGRIVDPN